MGRASSVSVLRVAGRTLVLGSTDEQITLLAEVDEDEFQAALAASPSAFPPAADGTSPARGLLAAGSGTGSLAGSVLDRRAWTSVVQQLRERTVRR
jgi:flagellar protein FliO/FliZ